MVELDSFSENLRHFLSRITSDRVVGASGLAVLCAASALALAPVPEPTFISALGQWVGGLGLNVLAGVLQQSYQGLLSQPTDDELDRLARLAESLTRDIRRQAKLRREIGTFLDNLDAVRIAEEVVRGNPVIHGWLLTQIYNETSQYRADFDQIHVALTEMRTLIQQLERRAESPESLLAAIKATNKVVLTRPEPWMQALFLNKLFDSPHVSERYLLRDLLMKTDGKIVLVGKSGSGKTCAMKRAAYALDQKPQNTCVWIPLKSYARSLENTVKKTIGWHELPDNKIMPTLQRLGCILLFDGLNEVSDGQREQCAAEIEQLIHSYQGSLCVSYPTVDHTYFNLSPAYETLPLTEDQIQRTVESFFEESGDPEKATLFLNKVAGWSGQRKKDFYSLAQIPINLHFFLELAESEDVAYRSLRDLYGEVIEKRLRRTRQRGKSGRIPIGTKTECLMDLAFYSIIEDRNLQMSKAFVNKIFSNRLRSTELALTLDEIIRSGLLFEVHDLILEWPHPSFRDYLAGRRLFELAEMGKPLDEFPLGKLRGIAAVAHAVGLSTAKLSESTKRRRVFHSLLQKEPIFEAVQATAAEYNISGEISDCKDFECAEAEYKRLQWSERFLEAYRLITDMAYRESFTGAAKIPHPQGLIVLFSSTADFCLMMFSDTDGVCFGRLEDFETEAKRMTNQGIPCAGFALYAPFLLLLDPEIMAYLQVGVWLRLRDSKDNQARLTKWHDSLSAYVVTPNDWISWGKPRELPEPKFELCAGPEQTLRHLTQVFTRDQIESLWTTVNIPTQSKRTLLSWKEIYVPITFQVDPVEVQTPPMFVSDRLSQLMLVTPPPHRISLALLMPWTAKVDKGISIFVPSPVPLLNRYYFFYSGSTSASNGNEIMFAHLRG